MSEFRKKEWKIRVVQEKVDLDAKIERLDTFISAQGDCVSEGVLLLKEQLRVMREYVVILGKRIALFDSTDIF